MDPDEIAKHIPEMASAAKVVAASVPFTAIVKRMLGPAADEVAEMWRDQARVYRYGRQLKLLEKFEKMSQEAGLTPQAVPPKILFPLLEGASFEDNEDLHTMWSALLANAASADNAEKVRPGFIAILKQMAPDEAALLNWIYDRLDPGTCVELPLQFLYPDLGFARNLETAENRLRVCIGGLESAGLITAHTSDLPFTFTFQSQNGAPNFSTASPYSFNPRGLEFVRACRPPKPKS